MRDLSHFIAGNTTGLIVGLTIAIAALAQEPEAVEPPSFDYSECEFVVPKGGEWPEDWAETTLTPEDRWCIRTR